MGRLWAQNQSIWRVTSETAGAVEDEWAVRDTQNSLDRIRWMDGRENFHRAAAGFALKNVHPKDSFHRKRLV